jgi:hypothetical protein
VSATGAPARLGGLPAVQALNRIGRRLPGVEDPDAAMGEAGEPGHWLAGHEGLNVVPVAEQESELVEEGEAQVFRSS